MAASRLGAGGPGLQRARLVVAFLADGRTGAAANWRNTGSRPTSWPGSSAWATPSGKPAGELRTVGRKGGLRARRRRDPAASRLVQLADVVVVFLRIGGVEAAVAVARRAVRDPVRPRLGRSVLREADALPPPRRHDNWDAIVGAETAARARRCPATSSTCARGDRRLQGSQVAVHDRPFASGGRAGRRSGPRLRARRDRRDTRSGEPGSSTTSAGSGCRTGSGTSAGR